MNEVLPKGWKDSMLCNFCSITMGQSPPGKTYNTEKKGLPFFQGKAEFGKMHPTPKKYCNSPKKIANAGDILLSVRAPVGPTNISSECCCIGRGLASIRAYLKESQSFAHYYLISIQDWLSIQGAGSTFQAIGKEFLFKLSIPIPPLNEQKRIVAKLDKIIPRIDKVKERLDKIPVIIKRFRQSVLTAAVTGKLTEEWRKENPCVETAEVLLSKIEKKQIDLYKKKKISKPKYLNPLTNDERKFAINKNWKWCRLSHVTLKMSTGPFGSMLHKSDYIENGIPVINPTNIVNGKILPLTNMMISKETLKRLSKYSLFENDVILARRGDLSKCGIITKNEEGWLCGTGSFFLKFGINPFFFRIFYISKFCQLVLNTDAIGSTMNNLNQKVLSNIPFPLPPLEEQKEIVRQVDNLFALADKLETHYQKAKAKVDKLSQSVLAKAFRGELVPQDPNDEPAEKLLERIMKEKAKMEAELKKTKKKKSRKKAKSKQ
jgi:type I restriction enzyme S subunit